MTARAAVLFDLDGTLIDSAPDLAAAVNTVLATHGAPALSLAEVTRFIGDGTRMLVARALAARGLPEADIDAAHAAFRAAYDARGHALTRPYPGVRRMLARLAAQAPLAVVTNKPAAPARDVLAHLGLAGHFAAVIGGDSTPALKPDAAPLRAALAALGTSCGVMVGDSEADAGAAAAAGLPFALYTRGYARRSVAEIPHAAAFDDHAALPDLLARLTAAA